MKENLNIPELKNKCVDLRKNIVSMIWKAQSGHPGGSLSVAEFMTACYWHAMDVDPKNPRWPGRDRFGNHPAYPFRQRRTEAEISAGHSGW